MTQQKSTPQAQQQTSSTLPQLKQMLGSMSVKNRFADILKEKAPAFISSIISAVNSNPQLQQAEPMSTINAAVISAVLDLPINNSLGFSYIVPFFDKKRGKVMSQFQIGYKGIQQLALRSGQYKTINVTEVYEGEIKSENRFTGEYEFGEKTSDRVVGYMAYFKLINGFEKYLYMTKAAAESHGKKYSQTFKKGLGLWSTEFDTMAKKTVIKMLLTRYGILSVEMQRAQIFDQAIIKSDLTETPIEEAEISYEDNPSNKDAKMGAVVAMVEDAEVVEEIQEEPQPRPNGMLFEEERS